MDLWHPPCSQLSVLPSVADVCKGDHLDLFGVKGDVGSKTT